MLVTSAMPAGQMSGSLGGLTASHNRFGSYFRSRTIPTNPNSSRQNVVRSQLAALSQYWNATLTSTQRSQWDVYAAAVPWTNRVGQSVKLTGFNMFCRSNAALLQAGLTQVDDGPAILTLPETDPTLAVTISAATQLASVAYDNSLPWANEAGGALLISIGTPQAASRNYFGGPYRYAGLEAGSTPTPPTSPQTVTCPFTVQAGQKVWCEARVVRADGRLSTRFLCTGVCAS